LFIHLRDLEQSTDGLLLVTRSKFLMAEGPLQNQDGVIRVKAVRLAALSDQAWSCGHMTSTTNARMPKHDSARNASVSVQYRTYTKAPE
jgi:hypothetical protein